MAAMELTAMTAVPPGVRVSPSSEEKNSSAEPDWVGQAIERLPVRPRLPRVLWRRRGSQEFS